MFWLTITEGESIIFSDRGKTFEECYDKLGDWVEQNWKDEFGSADGLGFSETIDAYFDRCDTQEWAIGTWAVQSFVKELFDALCADDSILETEPIKFEFADGTTATHQLPTKGAFSRWSDQMQEIANTLSEDWNLQGP